MKKGWEIKRLDEVCDEIFAGGDVDKTSFSKVKTEKYSVPIFTNGEKNKGLYGYTNVARVTVPSITISARGTIGYSEIREESFYPAIRLIVVIPNKDVLDLHFLQYVIQSIDVGHSGTSIPQLTVPMISGYSIPIPPLPEQQRIVSVLDEAFASIAQAKSNAERNLVNARELFGLYLQNELVRVGKKWGIKSLGDVCEKVEYGSSAKSQPTGKVPVLRMGNIQNSRFDWTNLVYTSNKDEIKKYLLKHNDVLFNRTNSPELVGKTAIYKSEMPAIFAGYLIRIHRKEDLLDADYLNYFLNSDMAIKYGKTVFISSVNQANINGQKLKSYPIPIPPLAEQRAIVGRLEALSAETKRLEAIYKNKVESLEELKKSVLGKAFSGEV